MMFDFFYRYPWALCLFAILAIWPVQAVGQTLDFNTLLARVHYYSHDLKLADMDIEINRQRLKESRAAYLPTLNLRYTNEWFQDLTDAADGLDSVGGTVISSTGSKWKNVLGLSLNYNLYDFGMRGRLYDNSKRDVAIARLTRSQEEINLKLQLLDLYIRGWKGQEEQQVQQLALKLRQEIFRLSQRLYQAGSLDRLQVGEAAIAVAEATQRLDELRMARAEVLHGLARLSGETYDEQSTRFAPLTAAAEVSRLEITTLPEIRAYDLAIQKKQAEYQIARTSFLPRLSLYSSYSLYGSDADDWSQAISNLEASSFSCGIMLDLNVFNGLADQAKAARLQAEVQRLKLERDKKIAELENTYRTLQHHARLFAQCRERWQEFRDNLDSQSDMTGRLAKEQLRDRLSILNQRLELAAKALQVRLQEVERTATLLKLQILAGGQNGDGAIALSESSARTDLFNLGFGDSYDGEKTGQ